MYVYTELILVWLHPSTKLKFHCIFYSDILCCEFLKDVITMNKYEVNNNHLIFISWILINFISHNHGSHTFICDHTLFCGITDFYMGSHTFMCDCIMLCHQTLLLSQIAHFWINHSIILITLIYMWSYRFICNQTCVITCSDTTLNTCETKV